MLPAALSERSATLFIVHSVPESGTGCTTCLRRHLDCSAAPGWRANDRSALRSGSRAGTDGFGPLARDRSRRFEAVKNPARPSGVELGQPPALLLLILDELSTPPPYPVPAFLHAF